MYFNRIKNFIITFLVILAVYQTARLWFEGFSGHSLFYSIFSEKNSSSQDEIKYTLESIVVNTGNNKFIKKANDIYSSEYKPIFDDAITETLKKGTFKSSEEIDWSKALASKCVIFNYSYTLDNSQLKDLFNAKPNVYTRVGDFNTIIITPDINVPESMRVVFANTTNNRCYIFELTKSDIITKAYAMMSVLSGDEGGLYYISSVQNGFELFSSNAFLPEWNGSITEYPAITMKNSWETNGGVLLMTLEKNINKFFENPAVKWTSTVNDIYTYSDESTVVKYYTTGVLEYSNYKSSGTNKPNFYKDYLTAISFIKKDDNIKNEYYLKNYEKSDDKMVFYFDYKINDLPIILSSEYKKSIDMKSIIEVTVSGGRVTRYRRLVYEFGIETTVMEVADVDFLKAVDEVYAENKDITSDSVSIDEIELGYTADKDNDEIVLSWFITLGNKTYVVPAKS